MLFSRRTTPSAPLHLIRTHNHPAAHFPSYMTNMKRKILVPVIVAAAGTAWLAVDLWRPVSTDLRNFDPEVVAKLDTDMWRSYYDKERLKLFNQLAYLLRQQYQLPLAR